MGIVSQKPLRLVSCAACWLSFSNASGASNTQYGDPSVFVRSLQFAGSIRAIRKRKNVGSPWSSIRALQRTRAAVSSAATRASVSIASWARPSSGTLRCGRLYHSRTSCCTIGGSLKSAMSR